MTAHSVTTARLDGATAGSEGRSPRPSGRRGRANLSRVTNAAILERALEPERALVAAAWLFGSRARGDARPASDLDLAVLLRAGATEGGRGFVTPATELAARLAGRLGGFGVEASLDLIVMDSAPVDLAHRVLREGVLVFEAARDERVRHEMSVRSRYWDMAPFWREYRRLRPGALP